MCYVSILSKYKITFPYLRFLIFIYLHETKNRTYVGITNERRINCIMVKLKGNLQLFLNMVNGSYDYSNLTK